MKIFIKYFSIYRERFQKEDAIWDCPLGASVRDVFFSHFREDAEGEIFFKSTRFAVNAEFAPVETVLNEGDELVFIPPVSGG